MSWSGASAEPGLLTRRLLRPVGPSTSGRTAPRAGRADGQDLVVEREGADDPALAARAGPVQTEQSDDVGAVGVEVLTFPRAVQPDLHTGGQPFVAHVGEQIAVGVLSHRATEVEPEAHVRQLDLRLVERVDRETAEQDEAPPRRRSPRPCLDVGSRDRRERECRSGASREPVERQRPSRARLAATIAPRCRRRARRRPVVGRQVGGPPRCRTTLHAATGPTRRHDVDVRHRISSSCRS